MLTELWERAQAIFRGRFSFYDLSNRFFSGHYTRANRYPREWVDDAESWIVHWLGPSAFKGVSWASIMLHSYTGYFLSLELVTLSLGTAVFFILVVLPRGLRMPILMAAFQVANYFELSVWMKGAAVIMLVVSLVGWLLEKWSAAEVKPNTYSEKALEYAAQCRGRDHGFLALTWRFTVLAALLAGALLVYLPWGASTAITVVTVVILFLALCSSMDVVARHGSEDYSWTLFKILGVLLVGIVCVAAVGQVTGGKPTTTLKNLVKGTVDFYTCFGLDEEECSMVKSTHKYRSLSNMEDLMSESDYKDWLRSGRRGDYLKVSLDSAIAGTFFSHYRVHIFWSLLGLAIILYFFRNNNHIAYWTFMAMCLSVAVMLYGMLALHWIAPSVLWNQWHLSLWRASTFLIGVTLLLSTALYLALLHSRGTQSHRRMRAKAANDETRGANDLPAKQEDGWGDWLLPGVMDFRGPFMLVLWVFWIVAVVVVAVLQPFSCTLIPILLYPTYRGVFMVLDLVLDHHLLALWKDQRTRCVGSFVGPGIDSVEVELSSRNCLDIILTTARTFFCVGTFLVVITYSSWGYAWGTVFLTVLGSCWLASTASIEGGGQNRRIQVHVHSLTVGVAVISTSPLLFALAFVYSLIGEATNRVGLPTTFNDFVKPGGGEGPLH
jgi:hypothetical protein